MNEPTQALEAYFAGDATEQQVRTIEAWIHADDANAKAFIEQLHFRELLGQHVREQRLESGEILAELARCESEASPMTVTLHDTSDWNKPEITREQWAMAGRYLLDHLLTPKRVVTVAAAAVVLLVVSLTVLFMAGGPEHELDSVAIDPIETTPALPAVKTVARLTDQVGAEWRRDDRPVELAVGTPLSSGQSLTLTHGFAEITTQRGAVALIQSPATIELTDSDNAILLHQGKLVGKCPTRQSRGFNVLTPSTQVIDLGTEFGVEVHRSGETNIFVFDGLVALAAPDDDPRTAELTELPAGQAKRIDRVGRITTIDPSLAKRAFVRSSDPDARYEQRVLADKPLVYYRMDQFVGGFSRNLAADRYHAKVFGKSETVTDGLRSFVSLGSFGDYLQTTEPIAELRGARAYTMECWVKMSRHGFGAIGMLASNNPDIEVGADTAVRLETTGQGPLGIGLRERIRYVHFAAIESEVDQPLEDYATELFAPDKVGLSQWMHLAAVKDGDRMILYLNGEVINEADDQSPLIDRDLMLTLGRFSTKNIDSPVHTRQFIGELDELAVYDHALTPDSIRERFEAGQFWLKNE